MKVRKYSGSAQSGQGAVLASPHHVQKIGQRVIGPNRKLQGCFSIHRLCDYDGALLGHAGQIRVILKRSMFKYREQRTKAGTQCWRINK